MPKVIFRIEPVVCVTIIEEEDENAGRYNEPIHGFASQYLAFQVRSGIIPAVDGSTYRDGKTIDFLTAEDAAKAKSWLLEQGAEFREYKKMKNSERY